MPSKQTALARVHPAYVVPTSVDNPKAMASYARQLGQKDIQQILNAVKRGDIEIASSYLWEKTMAALKRLLSTLGAEFLAELLERPDLERYAGEVFPTQVLTHYEALQLAEELGVVDRTQSMHMRHALDLVTHYTDRDAYDDASSEGLELPGMNPEDFRKIFRVSIDAVLGHDKLEGALAFSNFRRQLEERTFKAADPIIQQVLNSAYFFQRTTLRVLLSIAAKTDDTNAQLDHALANLEVLLPELWNRLKRQERWSVGETYADVHNKGKVTATASIGRALNSVHGFDYVPEDLRSRTFRDAAKDVLRVHFGADNFYNEPGPMKKLASLGTTIPMPAVAECTRAALVVRLGNYYGASFNAQEAADQLLAGLSTDKWVYFLDEVLPTDDAILSKISSLGRAGDRWPNVVTEFDLDQKPVTNRDIKKLLSASKKGPVGSRREAAAMQMKLKALQAGAAK